MDRTIFNVMNTCRTDHGVHRVSALEHPSPAALRLEPGAVSACDAHRPAGGEAALSPKPTDADAGRVIGAVRSKIG